MMVMIPIFLVIGLVCLAIFLIPFWFICKKAGFSPWLTLLNIIPLGNLVLIYVLAFAEWKVAPAPQQAYYPPQPPYPPQS
jgi:flagellar basal body-associated protein FliL